MRANLCDFVLRLYRGSRECDAARFMDWALDLTRALIPFDSAVWAIGVAGVGVHSATWIICRRRCSSAGNRKGTKECREDISSLSTVVYWCCQFTEKLVPSQDSADGCALTVDMPFLV